MLSNFGCIVSSGVPAGFAATTGPLPLVITPNGKVLDNQPFGISPLGPAAKPEGQIGCPVSPGVSPGA